MSLVSRLSVIFVLAASALFAQGTTVTTDQLIIKGNAPSGVPGATTYTVGQGGNASYYYWIIAKYPVGDSLPLGPIPAYNANPTLSVSNYIRLVWTGNSDATGYDILRTSTPVGPNGSCTCAVVTNTASTSVNDTGSALGAYTIASATTALSTWYVNNLTKTLPMLTVLGTGIDFSGALATAPNKTGTGAPVGSCITGTTYQRTDAASLYVCVSSAWSAITSGGSAPSGPAGGDLTGTYPNPTLATSGVAAATYGSATQVPQIAIDAKGRVTSASNTTISGVVPGGAAGGDLTGTYPNPTLGVTAVTPGTYGSATQAVQVTFDAKGRATSAANVTIAGVAPGGAAGGDLTGTYPNPTLATSGAGAGTYGSSSAIPVLAIDAKGRVTSASTATPTIASIAGASGTSLQYLRVAPNYTSTTYEWVKIQPGYLNTDYAFYYVSGTSRISGSLAVAGAKSVTLTPCPAGVAGANADHYLYITGGVGTAESVLITGGTCTSGAASGTVTFTTVNNHSGAWQLQTATAGLKEAYHAYLAANPGTTEVRLSIADGDHTIQNCTYVGDRSVFISGAGMYQSRLTGTNANACAISAINTTGLGYTFNASGFNTYPSGITYGATVPMIYVQDYPYGGVQDAMFQTPGIGIDWYNISFGNPLVFENLKMYLVSGYGLKLRTNATTGRAAGIINNFYADATGASNAMLYIDGIGAGWTISNLWFQRCNVCMDVITNTSAGIEATVSNFIFDQDNSTAAPVAALRVTGTGATTSNGISFSNGFIQTNVYGAIFTNIGNIALNTTRFNNRNTAGSMIVLDGVDGASFTGNSYTLVANTVPHGFILQNTVANVAITGGVCNATAGANAAGDFLTAGSSVSNVTISGVNNSGFGIMASQTTAGAVKLLGNAYTDVTATIGSAATVTLPNINVGGLFNIGGTTTVTRLLGGFNGATYLVTTPSSLTFNTGGANPGNFAAAVTTAAGGTYLLAYNSTDGKWYIK